MATSKEPKARLKINKLLEEAGWRLLDSEAGTANVRLEENVKIESLGDDFEGQRSGVADFLLLDGEEKPLAVLEAKREQKSPLDGKEQAREYAQGFRARFVLLSNGNSHYFWDLQRGEPRVITQFPTQESLLRHQGFRPDNRRLGDEPVDENYIAETQKAGFRDDPDYQNEDTRAQYLRRENLQVLYSYQLEAVRALQRAAAAGKDRFLFEMATGAGKTLIAAAVIKLFLRTGNARRVLFLVDRLELEAQAQKSFKQYLSNDYEAVVYKKSRDSWKRADIVVSTVQSLAARDKYKSLFSPTDFDLLIADESHRAIGGNARAVFEYFIGYKLGLTATPKDYLKNIDADRLAAQDPRAWERRQLLDTYQTFGCGGGDPTFRYGLKDGVDAGRLLQPVVYDARTGITTEMLSQEGYAVVVKNEDGSEGEERFFRSDYEKKLFSQNTNPAFCRAFLDNMQADPLSGEAGKSIVFCVSQNHAEKITALLNGMAAQRWPGKYNSDFAVQVTSRIDGAQQYAARFANNNLNGATRFLEGYKSSKTRVCVTVGMMTTGYDCQDILNIALMRPVFSPTDFIQIKGRGTRKFVFACRSAGGQTQRVEKKSFRLFDFFANCEYFEKDFNYDAELPLPAAAVGEDSSDSGYGSGEGQGAEPPPESPPVLVTVPDPVKSVTQTYVGAHGMKIDRMFFHQASEQVKGDADVAAAVEREQWARAVRIVRERYENQPELYITLEKIRRSENLDRPVTWHEFLERVFGEIDRFKSRDEKIEDEVQKFFAIHRPPPPQMPAARNYISAYLTEPAFRDIIQKKEFVRLNTYAGFSMQEFEALGALRDALQAYLRDYVRVEEFSDGASDDILAEDDHAGR